MLKIKKTSFWMILAYAACCLGLLAAPHCARESGDDPALLLALLWLASAESVPPPDPVQLSRVARGLDAWQLGLSTNITAGARFLGDNATAHNPPNWITVTPANCSGRGVPASLASNCPLSTGAGGVYGACEVRMQADGRIVDSTILILDWFQNDPGVSDEEKASVAVHELGHCLGLKHTASIANVMYPTTLGANAPSAAELSAAAEAYKPGVQAPSGATRDDYYSTSGGAAVRHHNFPTFTVYAGIGGGLTGTNQATRSAQSANGYSESGMAPPQEPAPGPSVGGGLRVVQYLFRAGGRCERRVIQTP